MSKKFLLIIGAVILLIVVFYPLYNGQVYCGINPDAPTPCIHKKLNLIDYIKFKIHIAEVS